MRIVAFTIAAAALAACTTTPAGPAGPGGAGAGGASALRVCAMTVANAPVADRRRVIVGFDPIANVRGARLLRAPVEGCVSSGFGPRRGGAGNFHEGLDIYTGRPRAVVAGGAGVVAFVGRMRGYGRTVIIDHGDGVETRYAHLSSVAPQVRQGATIARGAPLGRTGDTGNATAVHLHYEIVVGGRPVDPLIAGR